MKTSTIVAISVGTVVTGCLAYAVYFDHRRRTDPEFRRAIKRDARRQARLSKEAREIKDREQQEIIKKVVDDAQEEGFPVDHEEREAFFMKELSVGEGKNGEGSDPIGAALCFYKALKVYPEPKSLITIYDNIIAKEILEILAVMCNQDQELSRKIGGSGPGSTAEPGPGVE